MARVPRAKPSRSLCACDYPPATDAEVDEWLDATLDTLRRWARGAATSEELRTTFQRYDDGLTRLVLEELDAQDPVTKGE